MKKKKKFNPNVEITNSKPKKDKRKKNKNSKALKPEKVKYKHNDINREFLIKYHNKNDSKVSVMKNILVNNGIATAYFILTPYNYDVENQGAIEGHITSIYNMMTTMFSSLGSVEFSIFNVKNLISKREVISQLVETIQLYNKNYNTLDPKYNSLISGIREDFTILAVNIDISKNVDIETQSVLDIAKSTIDGFFANNFSSKIQNINEVALMAQDQRLTDILDMGAVPATEKLVLNIYINSLFPDYNIVYNSFIMSHASDIIAGVKQNIIPHLGWFEMSNLGVATLGAVPVTTYGSILTVLKFPDSIQSRVFNMNIPGLKVNLRCRPKEKVELDFRRMRADTKSEYKDAASVGDEDNISGEDWDSINDAIKALREGRVLTDMDAQILVTAESKEELDTRRANIISILADMDVVVSIAQNQADTFIKSFVKGKPNEYYHITDLEYALSFNQDYGVSVGHGDDEKFFAPVIGEA